jgi:hypothetical protein
MHRKSKHSPSRDSDDVISFSEEELRFMQNVRDGIMRLPGTLFFVDGHGVTHEIKTPSADYLLRAFINQPDQKRSNFAYSCGLTPLQCGYN